MISQHLCNRITDQFRRHELDPELDTKKKQIRSMNNDQQKKIIKIIRNEMSLEERKKTDLSLETGASSWLTTLPIKEEGYVLNKQSFWDLLSIRYGWKLKRIPSQCASRSPVSQRRACDFTPQPYSIRNTTANLLNEVRKDVSVEPQLQPLRGEKFSEKTSNNSDQARVDISARGFWLTGPVAFFDVRVFNPTAKRYVNQELHKSYKVNENRNNTM